MQLVPVIGAPDMRPSSAEPQLIEMEQTVTIAAKQLTYLDI